MGVGLFEQQYLSQGIALVLFTILVFVDPSCLHDSGPHITTDFNIQALKLNFHRKKS